MFQTLVMICMISNPNMCYTLADTYGPYEYKKDCMIRAYEIASNIPDNMPDFVAVKYKCIKDDNTEGKVRTQWHMKTEKLLYLRSTT